MPFKSHCRDGAPNDAPISRLEQIETAESGRLSPAQCAAHTKDASQGKSLRDTSIETGWRLTDYGWLRRIQTCNFHPSLSAIARAIRGVNVRRRCIGRDPSNLGTKKLQFSRIVGAVWKYAGTPRRTAVRRIWNEIESCVSLAFEPYALVAHRDDADNMRQYYRLRSDQWWRDCRPMSTRVRCLVDAIKVANYQTLWSRDVYLACFQSIGRADRLLRIRGRACRSTNLG
jgi:hypothetical protein